MSTSSTSLTANLVLQKTKLDKLAYVKKLNVCGAQVCHIDVLKGVTNAEVLSLSVNCIEDLSPLGELHCLQELYLRRNNVSDILQVLHLSRLPQLTKLNMSDNPISSDPIYREFVISAIPSLRMLDDVEVSLQERRAAESHFPDAPHMEPPPPVGAGGGNSSPLASSPLGSTTNNLNNTTRNNPNSNPPSARPSSGGVSHFETAARDPAASTATFSRAQMNEMMRDNNRNNGRGSALNSSPRDDFDVSASVRGGAPAGGGGGWDDVPVGGKPMRRRPPPVQQPPYSQQAPSNNSNRPPGSPAGSPVEQHCVRTPPSVPLNPPQQYQSQPQYKANPSYSGSNSNPPSSRTAAAPPPVSRIPIPRGVAAGPSEEGVIDAIKLLLNQLSPAGLSEIRHHLGQ